MLAPLVIGFLLGALALPFLLGFIGIGRKEVT